MYNFDKDDDEEKHVEADEEVEEERPQRKQNRYVGLDDRDLFQGLYSDKNMDMDLMASSNRDTDLMGGYHVSNEQFGYSEKGMSDLGFELGNYGLETGKKIKGRKPKNIFKKSKGFY
jgi:hypothetical protein